MDLNKNSCIQIEGIKNTPCYGLCVKEISEWSRTTTRIPVMCTGHGTIAMVNQILIASSGLLMQQYSDMLEMIARHTPPIEMEWNLVG
jgi:hypothetical protein